MAIVEVTVTHECDRCGIREKLVTDDEFKRFAATWFDGFGVHFCNLCRDHASALERIREDLEKQRMIAGAIQNVSKPPRGGSRCLN